MAASRLGATSCGCIVRLGATSCGCIVRLGATSCGCIVRLGATSCGCIVRSVFTTTTHVNTTKWLTESEFHSRLNDNAVFIHTDHSPARTPALLLNG